jgi:hypothetical protein
MSFLPASQVRSCDPYIAGWNELNTSRIAAVVDKQILPRDEPGVGAAQERAVIVELLGGGSSKLYLF